MRAKKGRIDGKNVWIEDEIVRANGDKVIYYTEIGSYPYDTKIKVVTKTNKGGLKCFI